jgi:hypothetical protein
VGGVGVILWKPRRGREERGEVGEGGERKREGEREDVGDETGEASLMISSKWDTSSETDTVVLASIGESGRMAARELGRRDEMADGRNVLRGPGMHDSSHVLSMDRRGEGTRKRELWLHSNEYLE